jgi:hypothetical protein
VRPAGIEPATFGFEGQQYKIKTFSQRPGRNNRNGEGYGLLMVRVYGLRPEYKNHVWSYDFVTSRTHEGKAFRMLSILDEYTRECLDITVEKDHFTSGHRETGRPLHHKGHT